MFNSIEKIKEVISGGGHVLGAISSATKSTNKYYTMRCDILELTSFCPEDTKFNIRYYCVINDVNSWPIKKLCKCGCGNEVKNLDSDFLLHHGNKSEEVKNKKTKTFNERYNVSNPSQIDFVKEKKELTSIKNCGFSHHMKAKSSKEG